MGKWLKKAIKSGLYSHHNRGPHPHRGHHHWTEDSGSSSDSSDCSGHKGHHKKHGKKHMKRMHKLRHYMQHMNIPEDGVNNHNKAICALCCHQIKPLVETEILECGHIYHRLCLKELINLSLNNEQNDVFCVQCKQQINQQLLDTFQNRFAQQLPVEEANDGHLLPMNIEA